MIAIFVAVCCSALIFTFADATPQIELLDPEESTDPLVLQGFQYMQQTPKLVPQYSGDRLTCNNCHFNGGNTQGGASGGISLVGVVEKYPRRVNDAEISLAERISLCFERSLNGKPVPADDPVMKAIIAYLDWISEPVKGVKEKPWLGLAPLKSTHVPNAAHGAILYKEHCAICHKMDGGGSIEERGDSIPPVFGPHSYNDGAGMAQLGPLAAFIFHNMPQDQPFLTEEQALDVAAFIMQQERPHFID